MYVRLTKKMWFPFFFVFFFHAVHAFYLLINESAGERHWFVGAKNDAMLLLSTPLMSPVRKPNTLSPALQSSVNVFAHTVAKHRTEHAEHGRRPSLTGSNCQGHHALRTGGG